MPAPHCYAPTLLCLSVHLSACLPVFLFISHFSAFGLGCAGKPPCLVAVPTHFYKVLLAESKSKLPFGGSKVSVGAFVMPNDQIQPDMPLTAFAVPLEMLENVAGAALYTVLWLFRMLSRYKHMTVKSVSNVTINMVLLFAGTAHILGKPR